MKKYAILLLAGAVIGFASCGDDSNTTSQEQIDSAANAQAALIEAELRAKNDSLINAMAVMRADSATRADSMARVAAGKAPARNTTRTTTKTTTTTKPVVKSDGTKVTDRPGATDKRVNDQPEKPKSVSDRPGATDVNR